MVMPAVYNKFNRGEVSDNSIARDDVKKVINSASLMCNFWPQRLGPMSYRNGTEYKDTLAGATYMIPFVKKVDDTAILAFSSNELRVIVDDEIISRTTVASIILNPNFTSNIANWVNADGAGSTSAWLTGGYASLTGADTTSAVLHQTIATTAVEHGLRIEIKEAPARVRIGTGGALSSDILDTTLEVGTHSFLFTPASNPTITLSNSSTIRTLVDSVSLETTGEMVLLTGITGTDISNIRYHQSADVVYLATEDNKQYQVKRRGTKSWSFVEYRSNDGPFDAINLSDVTLTAAALSGNTTLTASESFFSADDVDTLYKLTSAGQEVTASVSAEANGTGSIKVTGITGSRIFSVTVSGTFVATVTLQRSADDVLWEDVESYTAVTSKSYDDGLDNATMYYRLYVKTGDYTSGTAVLGLDYASGSLDGVARVTGYTSTTVVDVQVLTNFGSTDATRDWYKGSWGVGRYPSAVALYEGRLFWSGVNTVWGSISDAYYSFDPDTEGASAAIKRTIGIGPVDTINWLCPTSRLIVGLPTEDLSVRSSSFGEVLTNLNANIKDNSGQGSAPIGFTKAGQSVYFVHHVTSKLIRLFYDGNSDSHAAEDMMTMHPEIAIGGIKRITVVRQPETRIFAVMNDGTARVFLHDLAEEVGSWARMESTGLIEDVITLPETGEDRVYFVVNHSGTRTLEKMTLFTETRPHDSHVFAASTTTTITGLSHLEGLTVGVWGSGADQGSYVVSSGSITVPGAYTDTTVGLRYTADYTSNKLSNYLPYSPITRRTRVVDIALLASNLHGAGLSVGPDSANLRNIEGASGTDYDQDSFPFDGQYGTNSRVHVQATGPCTIKALVYGIQESQHKSTKE
ncbi:hypothetical protein OAO65_02265 [Flavobacteriales bacterium]|nr:hypothetical protein [Flavobacteriales bacterium]